MKIQIENNVTLYAKARRRKLKNLDPFTTTKVKQRCCRNLENEEGNNIVVKEFVGVNRLASNDVVQNGGD